MTGEHGGVSDVLSDHGFAQTIPAHQDEIAGFAEEIQGQGTFDDIAFDLSGPGPIESAMGLNLLMPLIRRRRSRLRRERSVDSVLASSSRI